MLLSVGIVLTAAAALSNAASLPFRYGPSYDDELTAADCPDGDLDDCVKAVSVDDFYFYGGKEIINTLYISSDGMIGLNHKPQLDCVHYGFPTPNPPCQGQTVACFGMDLDPGANGKGHVFYRVVKGSDAFGLDDVTTARDQLGLYRSQIPSDLSLDQLNVAVVTWVDVTTYGGDSSSPTSTFQCAIAMDRKNDKSYVHFGFQNMALTQDWEGYYARIGVDVNDQWIRKGAYDLELPGSFSSDIVKLVVATNYEVSETQFFGRHALGVTDLQKKVVGIKPPSDWDRLYKTCSISGDPHYITFDGASADDATILEPNSVYLASGVIEGDDAKYTGDYTNWSFPSFRFFIETKQDPSYSWTNTVYFEVYFSRIGGKKDYRFTFDELEYKFVTSKNGKFSEFGVKPSNPDTTIPFGPAGLGYTMTQHKRGHYSIMYNGGHVHLDVDFMYTANSGSKYAHTSLRVPSFLKGSLAGYCGNLDGHSDNDNTCWRRDHSQMNPTGYGTCWDAAALGKKLDPKGFILLSKIYSTVDVEQSTATLSHANRKAELRAKNQAAAAVLTSSPCNIIVDHSGPFGACLRQVSLVEMRDACVTDVAATGGSREILCASVRAAAAYCQSRVPGVAVPFAGWPSLGCDPECPANAEWKDLASACPNTCVNPSAEDACIPKARGGCACKAGYLLLGDGSGECVAKSDFRCQTCSGGSNKAHLAFTRWVDTSCRQSCQCGLGGAATCRDDASVACGANAYCLDMGYYGQCMCDDGYHGDGHTCTPN